MLYRKIKTKEKIKIQSSTKNSLLDEFLGLKNFQNEKEIEKFLNPSEKDLISPYAFCDMEKATKRIFSAIENKQNILIWGDFDCDGVTSASVLYKALKKINANVQVFIPDRALHGHGLNSKELIKFISKDKIKLIITVDCGISNLSEINLTKSLGVDVIVTDHHSTELELPNAYAIINPQVKNSIKEEVSVEDIKSLSYNSGSVIAYKLAMALLENIEDKDLKTELLIVSSCGAVADVMPLLGEIRSMVALTIEKLNSGKIYNKGISKLFENQNRENITSTDIAFVLAPRINAVGRLANAKLSFEFLTEENEGKLDLILEKLENYNSIRQSKCQETYEEISNYLKKNKEEAKNPAIVLINKDWHIGIIGIVASKIVEEFNKPCFLATIDEENKARCSIRSNDTINVYEVLKENENLFLGFGGHKQAGGFSLDLGEISFEKAKSEILKTVQNQTQDIKQENILWADIELQKEDLTLDLIDTINLLEPFGEKNEAPICVMYDVILEDFKTIGKEQNHLRAEISKDGEKFNCVKWGEKTIEIPFKSKCDIAFFPRVNSFNDMVSIQLEIIDIYSENHKKETCEFKLFDHRKKTGILEQISNYLKTGELDICVFAKTPETKEKLGEYTNIKNKFLNDKTTHNGIMFFDYPSSKNEFVEILSAIKPKKIHLMNYQADENIENYIKQINGMIKYCANKLDGNIDLSRFSQALGVSENFVQITFEILENLEAIKILDVDKIEYLKPFKYEEFKENSMFELLKEEFETILNFKKELQICELKEIEEIIKQANL